MVRQTQGYPYFLQEWGKPAWEVATQSPITLEDVRLAVAEVVAPLRKISDNGISEIRIVGLRCVLR